MFTKIAFSCVAVATMLSTMANADCSGAHRVNGRLEADCHDESTGFDFTFALDDDATSTSSGWFSSSKAVSADRNWNKEISDHWHKPAQAISNRTTSARSLQERDFSFSNCLRGIAGLCSSDHAVAYAGLLSAFADNIISLVSEMNTGKREAKDPRSICYLSKEVDGLSDKLCVSWAYNDITALSQEQITAIGNLCTNNCQLFHDSCQLQVVTPDHHNYFCVSDRPKGCTGDNAIMQCVI